VKYYFKHIVFFSIFKNGGRQVKWEYLSCHGTLFSTHTCYGEEHCVTNQERLQKRLCCQVNGGKYNKSFRCFTNSFYELFLKINSI